MNHVKRVHGMFHRSITTTALCLKKPQVAALARKAPRTCDPDFTRCRGASPLEGEEDPILGPDEDYPDWLWEIADTYNMPIDEHLQKPDHNLFTKINDFRMNMNNRVMKLRHKHPDLYSQLKFPTEEEIIDEIREVEARRRPNLAEGQAFALDLREKAATEIGGSKGGLKPERMEEDALN
ncbi:uncharacterized protein LOC134813100 [Bolinopsis microptera]|uniref:uncharacterized protein LOC134813100 n=1 Tax=Bolinopsis microptera TaxID=2820187 RepID=UPI00307AA51F